MAVLVVLWARQQLWPLQGEGDLVWVGVVGVAELTRSMSNIHCACGVAGVHVMGGAGVAAASVRVVMIDGFCLTTCFDLFMPRVLKGARRQAKFHSLSEVQLV